ncbi:MAG: isoprenylcysteine carboxylmethyltransferase family protein [Thermoplasmatota archaeon]
MIVIVHVAFFIFMGAESMFAPWTAIGWWTIPGIALFVAAEGLRLWARRTLGPRFTTRVVIPKGGSPLQTGPYRWVRHPIYLAVFVEFLALPLAFGCMVTALVCSGAYAIAVRRRIRIEDRAWAEACAPAPAT